MSSFICKNCLEEFPNKVIKSLHTVIDCARNRQLQKKKQNLKVQELREEGHVNEANKTSKNQKIVDVEKKGTCGSSKEFPSRRKPPPALLNKAKSNPKKMRFNTRSKSKKDENKSSNGGASDLRFNTRSKSKKDENKSSNGGASDLIVETSQAADFIMEDVHGKVTTIDEKRKESKLEVMADGKEIPQRPTLPRKRNRKRRKKNLPESDFDENFNLEEKNSDLDSPIVKRKKGVVSRIVDRNSSDLKSPIVSQRTNNLGSSNAKVKMKEKSKLSASISSLHEKQTVEGSSCNDFSKSVHVCGDTDSPCENRMDQVKCVPSSKACLIDSPPSGEPNVSRRKCDEIRSEESKKPNVDNQVSSQCDYSNPSGNPRITKTDRDEIIRECMLDLVSPSDLAKKWKCNPDTIRTWVRKAGKNLPKQYKKSIHGDMPKQPMSALSKENMGTAKQRQGGGGEWGCSREGNAGWRGHQGNWGQDQDYGGSKSSKTNGTTTLANDTAEINEIEGHSIQSGILMEDVDNCRQSDSSIIVTLGELVSEANKDGANRDSNIKMESGNIGLDVMPSASTPSSSFSISLVAPASEKLKPTNKNKSEKIEARHENIIALSNEVEVSKNALVKKSVASEIEKDNAKISPKEGLKENDKQKKKRLKKEKRKSWEMKRIIKKRALGSSSTDSDVFDNQIDKLVNNESNLKLQLTKEVNRKKSPRKGLDVIKERTRTTEIGNKQDHTVHQQNKIDTKAIGRTGSISQKSSGITASNDKSKDKCRQADKPSKNRKSLLKSSSANHCEDTSNSLSYQAPIRSLSKSADPSVLSIPLSSSLMRKFGTATTSLSIHGHSTNIPSWSKPAVGETMSLAEQLHLTDDSDENSENMNQVVTGKDHSGKVDSNSYIAVSKENIAVDNFVWGSVSNFVRSCQNTKNSIVLGSLKTTVVDSLAKEFNDETVMDSEQNNDINNSYNDPQFSENDEMECAEFIDASGAEISPYCNRLSPSLRTRIPAAISCSATHDDKTIVSPSRQLSYEDFEENKNVRVKEETPEQINKIVPIEVKKELVVTDLTPVKGNIIDDDDEAILLDVSYTILDEEEEDDLDKDVKEETENIINPPAEKIKSDLEHENRSEVVIKPVSVRDQAGTQLNNKIKGHRGRPRENKYEADRTQCEVGQFERGNYCLSVLTSGDCTVVGCPWLHVLDPKDAQDQFYSIYHQSGGEERTERLVSFWRFQAVKSVPTGCRVLYFLSEMASIGKLEMETRDVVQLVDFVNHFPNLYTMSREEGKFVMENLLKAFMLVLKDEPSPASKMNRDQSPASWMDMETFFDFVWNRIYLSSLRHGIVMRQDILEHICSLAGRMRRYCQLSDLMFLSSLAPTMWVPLSQVVSLLTRISELPPNSLDCSCIGQEHTRVACSYLAKTLSRLSNFEWAVLSREVDNLDGKLQALVNVVEGDSVENIGRFIERVRAMGLRVFLPRMDNRSETSKDRLARRLELGKWRDVAKDIVMIEKICVEDMVEVVEELYGLISQLSPSVAATGMETLLKELELLHCSNVHRELYCQLGLSLLVKLLTLEAENKMMLGARVVQCMVRTGVDLTTVKPLTVYELAHLVDVNCTPITFPLVLLDVYIQSGYIALAMSLVLQWDYLETYPRPIGPDDQHRKHLILEALMEKALVSCEGNTLSIALRIFEILCSGDVGQWPTLKMTKMTENGRMILVEMVNRNFPGCDLWRVVKNLDRSLQVATGEVARGVLVRLVQAGMVNEAMELYRWDQLTAEGTYCKQETRVPILKVNLKSYFSLEELQIVFTEFFNELKKTPRIAHGKDVFIDMKEVEIPPSTIVLHRRITTSKQEAVIRVCQVLAAFNPPMSVSIGVGGVPFISKEQVYNYIIQ